MMGKSNITYLDWNITCVEGCTPVSAGCAHCYAQDYLKRFKKPVGVTLHPERLGRDMNKLARIEQPQVVGIAFTGDLFHDDVPSEFLNQVFDMMMYEKKTAHHIFLILTKRPKRMAAFLSGWGEAPNVWLGVSVEDQQSLERRTFELSRIQAAHKWISAEPLLSDLDFHSGVVGNGWFNWLVVGCESGPNKRYFDEDWVRHIRDQMVYGCVDFMYKQGIQHEKLVKLPLLDGVLHNDTPGAGK